MDTLPASDISCEVEVSSFYFVRSPLYHSFALIQIVGEVPEVIPDEILKLVPGNHKGLLSGVQVINDEHYLRSQVFTGCKDWFQNLENKPWMKVGDFRYKLVGTYAFI